MRVCGLQLELAWEDPEANRSLVRELTVRATAGGNVDLVALPEMWPTGFTMRPNEFGEPPGGPSESLMGDLAAQTGATIGGSIATIDPSRPRARNVFTLVAPDGAVHRYAKIHPFAYGGETEHYVAGDEALTFEIAGARVTPLVCYDLRFAELFTSLAPRTDLFVLVANWPSPRAAHWRALLIARAIEAQCYVLGVNRVGAGGGLEYSGDSLLVSPLGQVLASLPLDAEGAITGDVDPAEVARVRAEFPFHADRRPDVYRRLAD